MKKIQIILSVFQFMTLRHESMAVKTQITDTESVAVMEDTLSVDLSDGRTLEVPLTCFPRLLHARVANAAIPLDTT